MRTKNLKRLLITIIFVIIVNSSAFAQFDTSRIHAGNSVSFVMPMGDFKNHHDNGYGIYGNIDYDISDFLTARFDLGWNKVQGGEYAYIDPYKLIATKSSSDYHFDGSDYDFWEITAGLRANVGFLYVEGRAGYFSGDLGGFGFVPAVGVRWNKFDLQASYAMVSDASFMSIRLAYYWYN